jgi:hypothetical protein
MPEDDDYEIEDSRLSQKITRDGVTVEVCIYRGEDDPEWTLEVVDQEGASTVFDERFPTDKQALDAVLLVIEQEGITCFLNDPKATRH